MSDAAFQPTARAPFALVCPATCFASLEKSDPGQARRIAGVISAETDDSQDERILQDGLDFSEALGRWGYFNVDHGKSYLEVVGVPETVARFAKGDTLPDGSQAAHACTWCEGHLTDDDDGRKTYEKGLALQKLGRGLGFSIEGEVLRREGKGGKTIARALVRHIAITHQPVNRDVGLTALLRSLSVGAGLNLGPPEAGSYGGEAAGRAYLREDLALGAEELDVPGRARRRKKAKKSPTPAALLESIYRALPGVSPAFALALLAKMDAKPKAAGA